MWWRIEVGNLRNLPARKIMSSHHIIRENQEPALLVVHAGREEERVVNELLEWVPYVVVCEPALRYVIHEGIKIDVAVVSHLSHNEWLASLQPQAPVKILTHAEHEPPWIVALYLLRSLKQTSVHIIGIGPEQIQLTCPDLEITCFHHHTRWMRINKDVFEKWLPAGRFLGVKGEGVQAEGLSPEGYVLREGMVRISGNNPFWVGEIIHI
jgi:hypothetical protein